LVVEDDGRVRELVTQSLRGWGYEVLVAGTGEEALALAVARTSRIDLLLTDVVLPGMNGRETAQALTTVHPETRVLYSSGYGEDIIAHGGALEAGIEFLSKPYSMDTLGRRVRELLDRR
jgi:DNA-binding response OmpR family regulator